MWRICRNATDLLRLPGPAAGAQAFYDKLMEGGYLLLGHSENLINLTADFELVHLESDLVYRRPAGEGRVSGTGELGVLVIDDSASNRQAIRQALAIAPDVEVARYAGDGEEGLKCHSWYGT